jgi:hypothetical protein
VLKRYEIFDQSGAGADMSFVLFTEPGCFPCTDPAYQNWLDVGKPGSWCCKYQAQGDTNGDGWINALDLFMCFRPNYNTNPGPGYDCPYD